LMTQYALRPNLHRHFDTSSPLRAALAHRKTLSEVGGHMAAGQSAGS